MPQRAQATISVGWAWVAAFFCCRAWCSALRALRQRQATKNMTRKMTAYFK
jgi:hypothetical protein